MYIIYRNNCPFNAYENIPYHILGIDPSTTPTAEQLASYNCYTFIDETTPPFDCELFYQIENWHIDGTNCYRTWTLGNQDQIESWRYIKSKRKEKLSDCDWTQLEDNTLSTEQRLAWSEYRQALRNIPQSYQLAQDVVWPELPNV